MTELVTDPLLRRALLEVVILGLACGPLGVWVLHERRAFAAESLSHAMLPGLVLAALAGAPLLLGAVGGIVLAAVLVAVAARDARVGGDTAVAVVVTALFGLGVVLALRPEVPARLGEILFGDPLGEAGQRRIANDPAQRVGQVDHDRGGGFHLPPDYRGQQGPLYRAPSARYKDRRARPPSSRRLPT